MIYIHIPFCKQKCSYCNFHFSTDLRYKDELILSIKKELKLRHSEFPNKKIQSLYFGGGTPSILTPDEIKSLIDEVQCYFDLDNDIEITLEANPDDLNSHFLQQISTSEVNRLSIGTQSFFLEDLQLMNRAHTDKEAEDSIKRAQDVGLENISIDLIYGSPTSSLMIWKNNLEKAIQLKVPHISSYALTVENKTTLQHWIKNGIVKKPDEFFQQEAFLYMVDFLKKNNFEHYEISNFALPNCKSKHNAAYWQYLPYLGLGPSAHSYDGLSKRSWNVANNSLYIKALQDNKPPQEIETLSEKDRYNEMIMIGLRTNVGVSLEQIELFSDPIIDYFIKESTKKIETGLMIKKGKYYLIPESNWFFADGIASDLFLV